MSDIDTLPEDGTDTTVQDDEQREDVKQLEDGNAEAAKYRRRLRDTEKQRDTLAAHVEALQRAHIEAALTKSGVKPDAVFAVAELADLVAEDGTIDADKLAAAVDAARAKFGITTPSKGAHVPGVGNQPATRPRADAWRDAFTPARKR